MHIIGAYVAFIAMVYVLDCTQQYEKVDALLLRLSKGHVVRIDGANVVREEPGPGATENIVIKEGEARMALAPTAGEFMAPLPHMETAEQPTEAGPGAIEEVAVTHTHTLNEDPASTPRAIDHHAEPTVENDSPIALVNTPDGIMLVQNPGVESRSKWLGIDTNANGHSTRRPAHVDAFMYKLIAAFIFSVLLTIGLILCVTWAGMGSPIHYTTHNDGVRWENGDSGVNYEWRTANKELLHDNGNWKHTGYKYGDDMNLSANGVHDVNRTVTHN